MPSRSVTDDRHREERATPKAPIRFRGSTRVVRNAMEVEPMCIVENETVSGTIFRQYVRLTMCSRVTQTCAMGKQLRVLRARTAGDYTTLCKEGARRMDVFRAFQRTRWYARIAIVPTSQVANRLRSSEYRRSGRDGKGGWCLADISFMRSTWRLTLLSIFRDRWRCRLRAMALISRQLKLNRARDSNHLPFVYGVTVVALDGCTNDSHWFSKFANHLDEHCG